MYHVKSFIKHLDRLSTFFALTFSLLYAIAGSVISITRYWQYEVFYFDFGIFDKAIWSVSKFSSPIIDHITLGEKIIFADHFNPSIFLLTPLLWIFPGSETLLVAQAVIVAASGFVLFLIARKILKNSFYSLCIMFIYFLFIGLQNAVITDFHEVTIAVLAFMLTFLGIVKKNIYLYFISFFVLLGFKESIFLVGIGIGIAVFFLERSWRKIAAITIFLSILWGILTIKLIIPFFSGETYLYAIQPSGNPVAIFLSFFDSPIKQHTLFYSFSSFGFLPLLSPPFWFLLFQDFFIRFDTPFTTRWGLGFHYSTLLATIMAVSSIYSLRFLQNRIKPPLLTILIVLLLLNALFLYRVTLRGPFALAYNPAFYTHTKGFAYLDEAIKQIPKNTSVMSQNNLAPHFIHTHKTVLLLISDNKKYPQEYYKMKRPDYILIDTRPGQSPNNYYGIKDMPTLLKNVQKDKTYKIIYKQNEIWIFKRV